MARAKKNRLDSAIVVTMRDLSRKTGEVVSRVMEEQRPVIIKARGGFAAILQPVDQERINQLVLDHVSDLIATREGSEQALAEGKTMTASELAEELGVDLAPRTVRRNAPRGTLRGYRRSGTVPRVAARRRVPRVGAPAAGTAAKAAAAKDRAPAAGTAAKAAAAKDRAPAAARTKARSSRETPKKHT